MVEEYLDLSPLLFFSSEKIVNNQPIIIRESMSRLYEKCQCFKKAWDKSGGERKITIKQFIWLFRSSSLQHLHIHGQNCDRIFMIMCEIVWNHIKIRIINLWPQIEQFIYRWYRCPFLLSIWVLCFNRSSEQTNPTLYH